jgi:hypothetical protein
VIHPLCNQPNFFDWGSILLFLAGAFNFGYSLHDLRKTRKFCKNVFHFEEELSEQRYKLEADTRRDYYNLALKRFRRRLANKASELAPVVDTNMAEIQFTVSELFYFLDEEIIQEDEKVNWEHIV